MSKYADALKSVKGVSARAPRARAFARVAAC
jgi:hypothetical protein